MPHPKKRNRLIPVIVTMIATLALTIGIYKNMWSVADPYFFENFQRDSEILVLGRLTADDRNLEIPQHANLGFASIEGFKYDTTRYNHGLHVLKNLSLPDKWIVPANLNDENWSNGLSKHFAAIAITEDAEVPNYVGRKLMLKNGDYRIIEGIEGINGYMNIRLSGPQIDEHSLGHPQKLEISGQPIASEVIDLKPYLSQYGLQGDIFSKLYQFSGKKLGALYLFNATFLSVMLIIICLAYSRLVSLEFSAALYVSFLFSPWLTAIGRNLYWTPFTWFIPAVAAIGIFYTTKKYIQRVLWGLMLAAFFAKSLMGYEYLSSIILFSAAIFAIGFFCGKIEFADATKKYIATCLIGATGFCMALLVHANLRGATIIDGLKSIYLHDVKRRTYGSPGEFDAVFTKSLSASPIDATRIYIENWATDFILGIDGKHFSTLLIIATAFILYRCASGHKFFLRDLGLLLAFLAPPISWYILAKAHSIIHTHISFVLWYFGFAGALLFISYLSVRTLIVWTVQSANRSRIGDI